MTIPNEREILSEVLLKLKPQDLTVLPMACKSCPDALWQIIGKPSKPDKVQVRCFCPVMHCFTWSPTVQEEILDCEHLYQKEEEEEEVDDEPLPAFLAEQQRQRDLPERELDGPPDHHHDEMDE